MQLKYLINWPKESNLNKKMLIRIWNKKMQNNNMNKAHNRKENQPTVKNMVKDFKKSMRRINQLEVFNKNLDLICFQEHSKMQSKKDRKTNS